MLVTGATRWPAATTKAVDSGYFAMESILARCGGPRRVLPDMPGEVRHKDHMPVSSPFVVVLTDPERRELSRRAHSTRTPHRDRIRARIVVAAGDGDANAAIARQVGVSVDTVRKWRKRFVAGRLAGLRDAPRSGRPRRLPDAVRAQVIARACELPATSGVPLSRWSSPELARELVARCQVRVSESTVRRWLAADALKPWQYRSWISIRDPDFAGLGRPRARPVRRVLGRATVGAERFRDLRGREDQPSGPVPLPPHPAPGARADDADRARRQPVRLRRERADQSPESHLR